MSNNGIGKYSNKEKHLNIEVTDNPKTGKGVIFDKENIIVNENGTILFNGKTYKMNLIQLSTGMTLKDGILDKKDKQKIAEKVRDILSTKQQGILGFFAPKNRAHDLNGMVLTNKRYFRQTADDNKVIYSKGFAYNDTQKRLYKSIQNTFDKISPERIRDKKSFYEITSKNIAALPPHPLDTKMKEEYTFTPFENENSHEFPLDQKSTIEKTSEIANEKEFSSKDVGIKLTQEAELPNFMKNDLSFPQIINLISEGKNQAHYHHIYNILPWMDRAEFTTKLINNIEKNEDQQQLWNAAEFAIDWIKHYQNYDRKDETYAFEFDKLIVAISLKLDQENNGKLQKELKNIGVAYDQSINMQITNLTSIPLIEPIPIKNDESQSFSEAFTQIKEGQLDHKEMQMFVTVFANDLKNLNIKYFSQIGLNELSEDLSKTKNKNVSGMDNCGAHFEKTVNFITNQILDCDRLEEAMRLVTYFIRVGEELKNNGDMMGFMEIYSALINLGVYSLITKTTSNSDINPIETVKSWIELLGNNFSGVIDLAKNAKKSSTIVPYIGTYMLILAYKKEEKSKEFMTMGKMSYIHQLIGSLRLYKAHINDIEKPLVITSNLSSLIDSQDYVFDNKKINISRVKAEFLLSSFRAKKEFFPDVNVIKRGNLFFQAVDYVRGTSDKYSLYNSEQFRKTLTNDLGNEINKDSERLHKMIKALPKLEISNCLQNIEAGAQRFLELRQQFNILKINEKKLLDLYTQKHKLFSKEALNLLNEMKKCDIGVTQKCVDLENLINATSLIEAPTIDLDKGKEEVEEINEQKPAAIQRPFEEAYAALDKLLEGAGHSGWKIGIVNGQAQKIPRSTGISSRKANSNSAKLIVENLLDRIDLLADQVGEDEGRKNAIRGLLKQIGSPNTWINEVVTNFPELKNKIDSIRNKVPEVMADNFLVGALVEIICNADQNTRNYFPTLFDGLPWINDEAFNLIELIKSEIKGLDKNKDKEKLVRAGLFIVDWMNHRQKYYAPDEKYHKALESVLIELNGQNNLNLIKLLDPSYKVVYEQIDDLVNIKSIKIFPAEKIINIRPKDGNGSVYDTLEVIKNGDINNEYVEAMAHELKAMNLYYFSKIRVNEFVKLAWSADQKRDVNDKKSPNLIALTDHFNKVSNYISNQILSCKDRQEAKAMVKYFIEVGNELKKNGDFFGFMQISSALASASINNLINNVIQSKKFIPNALAEWRQLLEKNNASLRQAMNKALENEEGKPVIPYVGIYMSDLTFVNENPSIVKDGKINAKKIDIITDVEGKIEKALDLVPKKISLESDLMSVIEKASVVSDDELYNKYRALKTLNENK